MYANPADVYMKYMAINYPKTEEDESKISKMVSAYEQQ